MEKEDSVPSSLQNNDTCQKISGIKRSLEISAEDGGLSQKKIKCGDSCSDKLSESLVSEVELLDNKFVLSETDGIYKCISAKYMTPNQQDGCPGEVVISLGLFKKDSNMCLTPARLPLNLSFNNSESEFGLKWTEFEKLFAIMPKLREQALNAEKEITSSEIRLNLEGSLFAYKGSLGVGAYGRVLKAFDIHNLRQVALKFQSPGKGADKELQVYQKMQWSKYFPKFFQNCLYMSNDGKPYNVSCLELLGKDLVDYRKEQIEKNAFTMSSWFCLWLQGLQALQDLHECGFVHKDIKPSNFMIGLNDDKSLRLIDFNMARKYRDNNDILLGQEGFNAAGRCNKHQNVDAEGSCTGPSESFHSSLGTVRYASINAHDPKKCIARRDDLQSLFYTFVELINGQLPWTNFDREPEKALRAKKEQNVEELVDGMPGGVEDFWNHVHNLGFTETPDYKTLNRFLKDALKECLVKENGPKFDWSAIVKRY